MTQEERWQRRYEEVMGFLEKNHRNPSKHYIDEKLKYHWGIITGNSLIRVN